MANRLEDEFPTVRWHPAPSCDLDHELMQRAIERGRQLRSEAIRRSGRVAFSGGRRVLSRAVAFLRCTALAVVGRENAGDCWRGAPRNA